MADYGGRYSASAMQRGRLVTAACHLIAADEDLGDGWEARHTECYGYLDAYRKFLREHEVRLLEAEREYRCEALRFISHPDQIVTLDDNPDSVDLELKSGGMPLWCPLQTAGQVLAMGRPSMRRFGLQLKRDGEYVLYPHTEFRDLDRFRCLIQTWWIVQDFRPHFDSGAIPS